MVNLTTVNSALKNFYIQPLREDINLKADPFASRIMKTANNLVGYNKIVRAALVGANGGAGAGSETGAVYRGYRCFTHSVYIYGEDEVPAGETFQVEWTDAEHAVLTSDGESVTISFAAD